MSAFLQVQDLCVDLVREGVRKPIVKGLNFAIERGQCLALVGESGSGKSVTAMAILQLLPRQFSIASSSSIRLGGTEIMAQSERAMCAIRGREVALISQGALSALNPVKRIGAQLLEACPAAVRSSRQADRLSYQLALLDDVGLPNGQTLLRQYPHQLSGGMRQRVLVAMALAHQPALLIADEPTTALDAIHQKRIMTLLKDIAKKRQLTLLLITHDLAWAATCADQVCVMRHGQGIECQPMSGFLKAPKHSYSHSLLAAASQIECFAAKPKGERQTVLVVNDVSVAFTQRHGLKKQVVPALKRLSLQLHQGETLAVVGQSGSGKSTLAKVLMGLQVPSDGGWRYVGPKSTFPMQMIFQDPLAACNPRWLVKDILLEGWRRLYPASDESVAVKQAQRALTQVALPHNMLYRFPHQCSGGECQRICIARALMVSPNILICDEPTSALDVVVQEQVLALLAQLQREHAVAIIYITHNLWSARRIAHRVMVLDKGSVVEYAGAKRVFQQPQSSVTRELLSCAAHLER